MVAGAVGGGVVQRFCPEAAPQGVGGGEGEQQPGGPAHTLALGWGHLGRRGEEGGGGCGLAPDAAGPHLSLLEEGSLFHFRKAASKCLEGCLARVPRSPAEGCFPRAPLPFTRIPNAGTTGAGDGGPIQGSGETSVPRSFLDGGASVDVVRRLEPFPGRAGPGETGAGARGPPGPLHWEPRRRPFCIWMVGRQGGGPVIASAAPAWLKHYFPLACHSIAFLLSHL